MEIDDKDDVEDEPITIDIEVVKLRNSDNCIVTEHKIVLPETPKITVVSTEMCSP